MRRISRLIKDALLSICKEETRRMSVERNRGGERKKGVFDKTLQGGEDSEDPLGCRSFSTKEPLNIGHVCRK